MVRRHARIRRAIVDRGVDVPRGALVGYDAYKDNVDLLTKGVFTALVAQDPATEAKQAIDTCHQYIENGNSKTGITAAVVGVIVNLAVFFAWHSFWPQGTAEAPFSGTFEWLPVVIAIASFVALWKYKADIMKVIGVCALLGLIYSQFM